MTNFLFRWIGISDDFLAHPEVTRVGWQYPVVLLTGLLVALPLWVAFTYWRQLRNLPNAPCAFAWH